MSHPGRTERIPPDSSSLRQLVERAQQGSAQALERLVLAFRPLVRRLSRVQGRADADLEQELYATFIESVRRFRPRYLTKFFPFLENRKKTERQVPPGR